MAQYCRWFSSDDVDAPVLNNVNGTTINVLDACLINGYNIKSCTITVASNVATVTCNNHGYYNLQKNSDNNITITGATPVELNGDKLVTYVDINTFTYPAIGVPDGVASGSITCKKSPIGSWAKIFSEGATKAIYTSTAPMSYGGVLRINENLSNDSVTVDMGSSAVDINTLVDMCPTTLQNSGNKFTWYRGETNSTAKKWILVGDSRMIYLFVKVGNYLANACNFFGDIISFRPGDNSAYVLGGNQYTSWWETHNSSHINQFYYSSTPGFSLTTWFTIGKNYTQTSPSGICQLVSTTLDTITNYIPFPSVISGGFLLTDIYVSELLGSFANYQPYDMRGKLPGVKWSPTTATTSSLSSYKMFNVINVSGKRYLAVPRVGYFNSNTDSNIKHFLFPLDDPWRE